MSNTSEATKPLKGWEHRIVAKKLDPITIFYLATVLYDVDGRIEQIIGEAKDDGPSLEDLKIQYPEAFQKPILDEDTLEEYIEDDYEHEPNDEMLHDTPQAIVKVGEYDIKQFVQSLEVAGKKTYFLACPNCGKPHFRHVGYMYAVTPFDDKEEGLKVADTSYPVQTCVSCLHSIITVRGKIVDVTPEVDMNAWKKAEQKATEAAGPGMINNDGMAGC